MKISLLWTEKVNLSILLLTTPQPTSMSKSSVLKQCAPFPLIFLLLADKTMTRERDGLTCCWSGWLPLVFWWLWGCWLSFSTDMQDWAGMARS